MGGLRHFGCPVRRSTYAHRPGRIHQDNGDSFGPPAEHERAVIVKAIKDGVTFITIPQANGQWQKGQPVYVIRVNGVEYIKTVDNGLPRDNLENLPEF